MLMGDRAKFLGLLAGVTFTAFLVTFASSFFCGMMTRGFALIAENPLADVWVMDPAVRGDEQTVNMPSNALLRVRSVEGVASASPLVLSTADLRFADGRFQPVQVIGIDDDAPERVPALRGGKDPSVLRAPDAAIFADGGTEGKLQSPVGRTQRSGRGAAIGSVRTRPLEVGDEVLVSDSRLVVAARCDALPRFPPRPVMYTTYSTAVRVLPRERERLTFVLVRAAPGVAPRELAGRIEAATDLRARTADDFKADTVLWYLENSEDVGDVGAMLVVALSVGLGITGVLFFLFTHDHLRYYAALKAMGTRPRTLLFMMLSQALACAALGAGIGVGLCALAGRAASSVQIPFRMMWFTPVLGGVTVLGVSLIAAVISVRPVLKLEPAKVLAQR